MTSEQLEIQNATESIHLWFREQVLESIKPLKPGKRRPVFRPAHQEIAMNTPFYKRKDNNEIFPRTTENR